MTAKEIVIDTNIWVKALTNEEFDVESSMALNQFMMNESQMLAVDLEGKIFREYNNNLQQVARSYQLCRKRLERQNRVLYKSSQINRKMDAHLYELRFHEPQDHVFVGVAMHADKLIVTEDSDYGVHKEEDEDKQKVFTYMKEQMGLQVVTAGQFVEMEKPEQ